MPGVFFLLPFWDSCLCEQYVNRILRPYVHRVYTDCSSIANQTQQVYYSTVREHRKSIE